MIKFRYIRDTNGKPLATIAHNNVHYSFCVCSEQDKCVKKIGRNIASGRLLNNVFPEIPSRKIKTSGINGEIVKISIEQAIKNHADGLTPVK